MLKAIFNLPRTVWFIGLISLVNDSASEMLYPLVPLYLASVLMAGPRVLGIIEGIAEATASLLKLSTGVVVDRSRRSKPWIVFGYGLPGVGRPLIAFESSWPFLLAIRFSDRVGKGLRSSPRDALLAASARPDQRGLAFGLHRAMDNAGAVIGPLLAVALLASHVPLKDIFLWSARLPFVWVGTCHPRAQGSTTHFEAFVRLAAARYATVVQTLPVRGRAVHTGQFVQHVLVAARQ